MAGSYNWDTNEWIEPDTGGSTVPVAGAPVQAPSPAGGGGIASWFGMGPQQQSTVPNVARSTMDNPAIQRIAKAYGITPDSKDPQQQLMLNHLRTMAQFQPKAPDPNAMMRARMGAALTAVGAALNPKVNLTKLSAQQLAAARQRAQQYQDSQSKFGMTMAQMLYQAQLAKLQRDRNISTFKAAMGGRPAPTGAQPGAAPGMPTPGTEFAPSGTIAGIMPGASVPPDAMPQVPAVPPTSDGTMPNYDPGQMQFGDIGQEQAPPADLPSVPGISVGSAVEDAGAPAPPPAPSPYAPTNAVATPNEVTTTQVAAPAGEAAPPPRDPSQPPPSSGDPAIDQIQRVAYARALQQAASDPTKALGIMQEFQKWAYGQRQGAIKTQIDAAKYRLDVDKFGLDREKFDEDKRRGTPEYQARVAGAKTRAEAEAKTQADARNALPVITGEVETTRKTIDELLRHPSFGMETSPLTHWMPSVTGDSRDFYERVEQARGKAFVQAFQKIKGAGAITEAEGRAAAQALARLQRVDVGTANFKKALEDFRVELDNLQDIARRRAGGEYTQSGATRTNVRPDKLVKGMRRYKDDIAQEWDGVRWRTIKK